MVCLPGSPPSLPERTLIFRPTAPRYTIVLLMLSVFFLGTTFLPFLYSVVFPNEGISGVLSALEGRAAPLPESAQVVQESIDAAGYLGRAIPVGYYSGITATFHRNGPQPPERFHVLQSTYIAWFQKHPKPIVLAITRYDHDGYQTQYSVTQGDPVGLVRAYVLPILLFGVSLFLVCTRKSRAPVQ